MNYSRRRADQARVKNLTDTSEYWELMPAWSPDGGYLAFTSRPLEPREGKPSKPGANPWVMQGAYGGSPTLISRNGFGYKVLGEGLTTTPPSWSPDGKTLAYAMEGNIHLYNLVDGVITVIKPAAYGLDAKVLDAPSWSPARNEIAVFFAQDDKAPSREEILAGRAVTPRQGYALLDLETKKARVLYEYAAPFAARPPALWSGDGERVALLLKPELIIHNPAGLVIVDREGRGAQRVGDAYQAAWEPGGARLAYIDLGDARLICVLSPAGGEWERQALRHEKFLQGLAWRPATK